MRIFAAAAIALFIGSRGCEKPDETAQFLAIRAAPGAAYFLLNFHGVEDGIMEANHVLEASLLERRRAIRTVLAHLKKDRDDVAAERQIDWLDRAADENSTRTVDRLLEVYGAELDGVEDALARIRTGSFGACAACHEKIEAMRLKLFPQTRFCAGCAGLREAVERAA
jgi:RNA polymerase-binding transcription factor DksA